MKHLFRTLMAAALLLSLSACSDDDDDHRPDTTSGATTPHTETPDTTSGATTPAEGSVAKGRIGTGTFIDYDGTTVSNAYGIDFNKDGQLEFRISDDRKYVSYVWSENGNNIANAENQWDIIEPMDKGASVYSGCRWEGQGDAMLPDNLPEKFYVGFRIRLGDTIHYGWAKVEYENGTLEWDKCAYNTVPSITAFCGED